MTFKILTWAQLELNLNLVESCTLNPGRATKERTLAQRLGRPYDVRTWGLSPYIKPGLLTTWSHCATAGHTGVIITERVHCVVREWGVSSSRGGWTGRDQAARNTGHTSHIATITSSQPQEHETWKWILIIHLTPFCCIYFVIYSPHPTLLIHLNVLSWLRIHWDESTRGQGLKDCQDVEELWSPGPAPLMLIIVYRVASQRGGPEWPWVTRVTPHSIVDTFY